ncbi:hypothetical protein VTK73DRAFT_2198 [Phialemonium thermophilum]|uniref:Uncharacterized protein n=1 Tax=Phialemonium thermophilum TaxID=223376 RepID=A0ABR3Y1E3_9PEZI
MSSLFSAQLYPQRALGFLVLGASLHEVLARLKSEPKQFPKLNLLYSAQDPVVYPVTLELPENGLRLRFDGPEQRLRLIEVLDFSRNRIIFKPNNEKERELVRLKNSGPTSPQLSAAATGPTFRHLYQRFLGPTYPGEFVPDQKNPEVGNYVLSYPGVAFTFPMSAREYSSGLDNVAFMSSRGNQAATSMAVFSSDSWAEARPQLWTEILPSVKSVAPFAKSKDLVADQVSLVRIHGGGKLQLVRRWSETSTWISLGETTPQDLVAELGPPDAIYRKSDQKMYVHKIRAASGTRSRPNGNDLRLQDDLTDTDQSSAHTASDQYDSSEDAVEDDMPTSVSGECFYNYFYLGFDVLVSTPTEASQLPPRQTASSIIPNRGVKQAAPDQIVATKMVLHGNVPGSYPFNRHGRCRWEIAYLSEPSEGRPINSETPFTKVQQALREEWRSVYASEDEAKQVQRGMVLNRGWGDSPSSSCELVNGLEEGGARRGGAGGKRVNGSEKWTTTLFGFPGLVFEVLRNDCVSAVTVF